MAIVLAGGSGRRLAPLTDCRSKPAVPFGGEDRLIDFVLSNLVNARSRPATFLHTGLAIVVAGLLSQRPVLRRIQELDVASIVRERSL